MNSAWIYVVDDDAHILSAFRRLLGSFGYNVLTFESPLDFLAAHDPGLPGCVLLDVGMTELSGLATQQQLLALGDTRPIIFVTGNEDVKTGVLAMKGGALDYLIKPVPEKALLAAVEAAVNCDMTACQERREIAELTERRRSLTEREREVMAHVVRGRLNKQIAGDLGIVEKTVKVHRARVMEKMNVRTIAGLVHIAERLENSGFARKPDAGYGEYP
ncbi:MAG TPA: response regulator [Rhizomicrobium sp.]|jgi:FixJ family two-component response regulator